MEFNMLIAWLQAKESEYHNTAENNKLLDSMKYSEYKGMEAAMKETQKYVESLFK